MGYDFFVFPAEGAEDLDSATALYESASPRGALTPSGRVDAFLDGLETAPCLERASGHDAAAYVATTWADPMANLSLVAGLARPQELSVLDVQLAALYDPRHSVEVTLDTEAGPQLPWLTRAVVREVVGHIGELRYHWVNLSRGPGTFVQAFRDADGSWAVEHRDGAPDRHFAARTEDEQAVERVLWSWARNDGQWQALLAFAPVEL